MGEKKPWYIVGINFKYSMDKWTCIAKEQGRRSLDGKLLRRNVRGQRDSGSNLIGFLLKTGQSDQTSPRGW